MSSSTVNNGALAQGGGLAHIEALRRVLNEALRGKAEVVELALAALLARGHLLIEDLPGLGKTTLAKALAAAVGGKFARIQCTPDLLPGDVTGFSVFNQQLRQLEFVPGPVFADVLLVDEINRATPRTQSALLEVMAERQVTVDNVTRAISDRFFVIATQNPVELEGTFPLPEAQLDRFTMKLGIGYPDRDDLVELLGLSLGRSTEAGPETPAVVGHEELLALQRLVAGVAAEKPIRGYLAELGEAVRQHTQVRLGVSPRGLLIWLRVAQAWAALKGRSFVTPDDVQEVALPVLDVRLVLDGLDTATLLEQVFDQVRVPAY
jgi:MoxR-like ATPase